MLAREATPGWHRVLVVGLRKGETRWNLTERKKEPLGDAKVERTAETGGLMGIVLSGVKPELESESGPIATEMKDHKAEGGRRHES